MEILQLIYMEKACKASLPHRASTRWLPFSVQSLLTFYRPNTGRSADRADMILIVALFDLL